MYGRFSLLIMVAAGFQDLDLHMKAWNRTAVLVAHHHGRGVLTGFRIYLYMKTWKNKFAQESTVRWQ